MKNIFTKFAIVTSILIGMLISMSCQKEEIDMDTNPTVDLSKLSEHEAYKIYQTKVAPLHSQGLAYIFELIKKDHAKMGKVDKLTDQFMDTEQVKKRVSEYSVNYLDKSITKKEQADSEIKMMNEICYNFVDRIHKNAKANLSPEELNKETIKILNDSEFQSLSQERRQVVMVGMSVYEDSYAYWVKNLEQWDDETQPEAARLDIWGRLKQIAKADLSGAVGGAVGGAVVGAFAGGVGAGPGAVGGAVGGAVSGSVTSALN